MITFVTCIYDDLFGTELGGRHNPHRKYLYGVESILKMDCPIVIFTWEKDVNRLKQYYENILGEEEYHKKIRIIDYDLYSTPIRETIKIEKNNPKNAQVPGDRSHDVMFGKFLMVKKSIEENYFNTDYFFWIDAGLSSSSLFPNKYLDGSIPEKQYSECGLFTKRVTTNLLKNLYDKILLVKCNSVGHWLDVNHLPNSNGISWYIIGGIFGGSGTSMKKYCDDILTSFLYHINNYATLYFEECIMTINYAFNTENFKVLEFDTWHHEDSGDWAQPHIVGKVNFYKIFEKLNVL